MALIERLMQLEEPSIGVHEFMSAMQEYMLNNMTGAQARDAFSLNAAEQTEALALRDRLLQEASANGNAQRRLKALEFENVLILAYNAIPPYTTPEAVRTRLGLV